MVKVRDEFVKMSHNVGEKIVKGQKDVIFKWHELVDVFISCGIVDNK